MRSYFTKIGSRVKDPGIAERYSLAEAGVRSSRRALSLLRVCHRAERQQQVNDALAQEAAGSSAFHERLEEAAGRVSALARRVALPPQGKAGLQGLEGAQQRLELEGPASLAKSPLVLLALSLVWLVAALRRRSVQRVEPQGTTSGGTLPRG